MKIKRIEICGFKSFVEKTSISFPDPITSIVGPNGCGKSNIVDAIRWVMGEQSAKHLRGRAMEDVIFSGSESRGPAGMAEVSLIFDARGLAANANPDGVPWGAVGPEEIVVTRRLHRDGESEYLLNGVPSRLRDVVEFFLGTGVGSKAYAIIEQGRIGFIVSSRAEDRRGLIDEAAGITKYKSKKRAAERRMESTRQHLLRVSDIIGEIEGRLRSLRLQAQKAERYKRYKGELKDLDLWSSAQRYLGHLAEEKSLAIELTTVRGQHEVIAGALDVEETSIEAERLSVTEEAHELASAKDDLFALSNKAQLGLQRAAHQDDEAGQLEERAEAAKREIEELAVRAAEQSAAIEELDGQLARLEDEAQHSHGAYAGKQTEHDELRASLALARRALDEATAELAAARARIARNEAERAAAEQRRDDLAARLEAIAAEETAAAERARALAADDEGLRASLAVIRARSDERKGRRDVAADRQGALRADVARGELELETLREEAHRRRSRLASLSEIQNRYESFQKGVRAIMQHREALSASGGAGIRGVVADIMQPPPELETAVEAVLGERLGNIIVESHEVGLEAIEFLKQKSEGRSSFIPLGLRAPMRVPALAAAPAGEVVFDITGGATVERGAPAPGYMAVPDTTIWPKGEGVRGPLLDLIGYDRQYGRIASYLLGDVVVVENLRRALELWRETQTTKTIVTLDGEVIDPQGVVTGGARESAVAGVLEQKREIRELEEVVAKLESDMQEALARHVARKQELVSVADELERLADELRAGELELFGQQKDLDRATEELHRFEARRAQLEAQAGELGRARADAEGRATSATAALVADAALVEGAELRMEELRARTTELGEQVDAVVQDLTALKVAAAQAEDRRQNARLTIERLRRERAEHAARAARLALSIAEETARAGDLRAEAVRMRDEASLWQAEAEARARAHGDRQDALEDRQTRLAQRDAELRVTRADAARLSQSQGKLELRHQEAALRRTSLEEGVAERYRDVTLPSVVQDYHLRPLFAEVEEARAKELRGLIERMGEINLTAIEESEELQARFDFLTAQRADLDAAISQLETAIEKINRASRKRFRETFDAVNLKFQEVFPRLFGGGHAHLALTDEHDLLETGVEIIANPPGKKVSQNIELLSGGEKALTAVSLLFAIFLIKPSPFCVLDEVDAPLDEANVGRFNQAVREMTDRSQFIIITHNRRTMEIADRLCGITMEEPGVSKLVAVNLRGGGKRGAAAAAPAADSATA
ncbi:MAG TPA: chromosome segregation protein SMC [Polyangia bacterium]|nr:chromosome segregation protein SMC [Polyangia bacterium]